VIWISYWLLSIANWDWTYIYHMRYLILFMGLFLKIIAYRFYLMVDIAVQGTPCTVVVCHAVYKVILFRSNVCRKRQSSQSTSKQSIACNSSNLEMYALEECMRQISNCKVFGRRLTGSNCVHDNDGKANGVIKQYFKDSKEKLDVSHGIKNIIKRITNQEWKTRIKITLFYCLRN
jgi:hypothetical protein